MSWLRIDDGFSRHPKVTALTFKERWVWMDLLCYCARYQTDGWLPENIREHVAGSTDKFLHRCHSLELLDDETEGWRIHDWSTYAPKDPTAAERQAAWRRRKRNGRVTEEVTGESSTSRAGTARVPVPSRPKEVLTKAVVLTRPAERPSIKETIEQSLKEAS